MPNTIFIHGGASDEGVKIIRKLLQENDYKTNNIKNKIICADSPELVYKVQEFLGFDEFTYLAISPDNPIDVNENITKVLILQKQKVKQ